MLRQVRKSAKTRRHKLTYGIRAFLFISARRMQTSASPHCGSSFHNNDLANHSVQDEEQKSRLHCGEERVIMPAVDE